MSTLRVTAEVLTVHEHPNADALELAQVGLYRAVVAKGVYRTGETALYIPEQAVLPAELIGELGLTGRLAGSNADRVRAVRLRGELSQGIVCRPKALAGVDLARAAAEGTDFTETLGITKWVPPVPPTMDGDVESAPGLLPWVDIENIQRHPGIFEPGEPVVLTEKVHGSACLLTYLADEDRVYVSSKGFGAKSLALKEDPRNLYWRAARGHGVAGAARRLAERLGARRVGIFGEVYGAGVQDLTYGADGRRESLGYTAFDVSAEVGGAVRWLDAAEVLAGELPLVPRLFEGPYDIERVLEAASGRETVSGRGLHLREGVVIRPAVERYSAVTGGRAIAKAVSGAYLTRKGGTEFE
ncbi:RNA ligase (ATP) [Streptomyces sp. NPDC048281]|uniref:RNA ligase (ATP) n=1 Tax=Streptomyces sp. NPDC048281 TaxID=3154715 RepID=UPI00342DB9EB